MQLLSKDKKAFVMARRLSLYSSQSQPQLPSSATAASGRDASPPEPAAAAAPGSATPTSRQRRSAARTRHAACAITHCWHPPTHTRTNPQPLWVKA